MIHSPTPNELRHATGGPELPTGLRPRYTQLPHPYPQVRALAESVTAGATTTYDRVQDLISWIGAHTHYSTDIPALPPGADTVNEFLFGNRIGYCEQISTSLAVMLRTLDIPVREVVGYVPGSVQPGHRPLHHPGRRRPCLGPGMDPGLRLAELRSDRDRSLSPTPTRAPPPSTTSPAAIGRLPSGAGIAVFLVVAGLGVAVVRWRRSPTGDVGRPAGPRRRTSRPAGPGALAAPARRSSSTPPPSTASWPRARTPAGRWRPTWKPASTAGVTCRPRSVAG